MALPQRLFLRNQPDNRELIWNFQQSVNARTAQGNHNDFIKCTCLCRAMQLKIEDRELYFVCLLHRENEIKCFAKKTSMLNVVSKRL